MEAAEEEIRKVENRKSKDEKYKKASKEAEELAEEHEIYDHEISATEYGSFKFTFSVPNKEQAAKVIKALMEIGVIKKKVS